MCTIALELCGCFIVSVCGKLVRKMERLFAASLRPSLNINSGGRKEFV